ncbi:MAG: hypothetical protein ACLTG0_08025 [Oscillibacter sp.]
MTNYTVLGRRRVVQRVTASYDAPTETVKAACRRALEQTENLLEDPAPTVYLTAYKESSIEYTSLPLGYAGELVGRVSGSGGALRGTPSRSTAWR